jgi:pyrimidine operon attenuation protein / uracil phosphoribosyltransferase
MASAKPANLTLPDAEQLVTKLAEQIRPALTASTALVGILTGGAWIAEKLNAMLGGKLPMGTLDISFYRDDFGEIGLHKSVKPSSIGFDVNGCDIILVDDVLYTGRTTRGAMNELFDYGRPASIRLAVLVDRGGRELPIAADFMAATLELPADMSLHLDRGENGKLSLSLHPDA